jgi:putative FmdB family regulatory protein
MPTYEYKCTNCSHAFEQFQSIKDAPLRKCPECGKNALERLIGTGAAVLFKGSGFYQTDYRSESYKAAHKAESSASEPKSGESSGGSGSDKAATKGESSKAESTPSKSESPKPAEPKPKTSSPAPKKKPK